LIGSSGACIVYRDRIAWWSFPFSCAEAFSFLDRFAPAAADRDEIARVTALLTETRTELEAVRAERDALVADREQMAAEVNESLQQAVAGGAAELQRLQDQLDAVMQVREMLPHRRKPDIAQFVLTMLGGIYKSPQRSRRLQ
jgi:ABC-type transporter Mla subunit MlaD